MADETTERIRILLDLEQEAHDRAARQSAREIARLERSYDPLSRAVLKLEREERQLAKALERGTITQQRHNQLLERAQAEYRQTAQAVEAANTAMARSQVQAGGVTGAFQRNGAAFQQLGYQVGDFAVQVGSGTSAFVAFGQQGSQLLGVLGPMGALMGAAVAIAAPLAAGFFDVGDAGEDAADRLDAFTSALDQARGLAEIAATPIDDLRERFGEFADEVQRGAQIAAQAALAQAMREMGEAGEALQEGLAEASAAAARYQAALDNLSSVRAQGENIELGLTLRGAQAEADNAREAMNEAAAAIGLTALQAAELRQALADVASAEGMEGVADAASDALDLIDGMFDATQNIPPEVAVIVSELQAVLEAAAAGVSAFDNMADAAAGAADEAGRIARNAALAARGQALLDDPDAFDPRGEGPAPTAPTGRGAALDDYEDEVSRSLRERSRSSGSRRSGSGGSARAQEPFDALAAGRDEQEKIRRQIELIGQTAGRVAELTARYTMLARAKREGIDLDAQYAETGMTVREAIDRQAESIGRLAEQYDAAKERAAFFEQQNEAVKDGILDAIVEGENLADTLRNVAKAFARAALEAALFNSGPLSGGGGGSLLGGIGSLFAGLFDKGGTIPAGKFGIAGERGPEIVTGPAKVMSTADTARAMSGGTTSVQVTLSPELRAEILQEAAGQSVQITQIASRQQERALPGRLQSVSARGT